VLKPGGRLAVSDIALKRELPPKIGDDEMAYVGCIAGAILIEDDRRILVEAGFAHVEVIDSGRDLNAYAKVENQAGCCPPPAPRLLVVAVGCCSPAGESSDPLAAAFHQRLADLLSRYNVTRSHGANPHAVGGGWNADILYGGTERLASRGVAMIGPRPASTSKPNGRARLLPSLFLPLSLRPARTEPRPPGEKETALVAMKPVERQCTGRWGKPHRVMARCAR
jgi:hypothetical protein